MNRRRFLKGTIVGATAAGAAAAGRQVPKEAPARKSLLKAGHQHHSSDADLRVLAALGVQHICSELPSRNFDESWSVAGLSRLRERVEKFGIKLDMGYWPYARHRL
jgi:mannonate dehydratase